MITDRTAIAAALIVVTTGILWGIYWLPVRFLEDTGLPGPWGTVAITGAASLLLTPFAVANWRLLVSSNPLALASIALGGFAFVLYSIGFVYGRVAIITLLFFLTPVWSTLIGRYIMGWTTPKLRLVAIAVGLLGLGIMLGAGGEVPIPRGTGEWMALASGILWSFATTGIRAKAELKSGIASFVFAAGGFTGALLLAPTLEPFPAEIPPANVLPALGWSFLAGSLWWGASLSALMWATPRLDPARVGILLMSEVLVGMVSAAVLAGERLSPMEMAGGGLVLCAGVLEVWPVRKT